MISSINIETPQEINEVEYYDDGTIKSIKFYRVGSEPLEEQPRPRQKLCLECGVRLSFDLSRKYGLCLSCHKEES